MKKRIVKIALRLCGLLAIAGLLAVSAVAGGGIVPDPNSPRSVVSGN